jgi:DNA-binding FadR family transcriptional regulator
MRFRKARQNRIFQDIVDQIQEAVVSGELQPGEKLPPERKLCAMFNTSRGTLREALRILEQKKLLSIKLGAGGGAIVREPNSELMAENLVLLLRADLASPRQLIAMAADLAAQVAALAATGAGSEDVLPLKQLVAGLRELPAKGDASWQTLATMDGMLFDELARIAGNRLYGFLLRACFDAFVNFRPPGESCTDTVCQKHFQAIRMIVYEVAQHDRKQAALLAQRHLLSMIGQGEGG